MKRFAQKLVARNYTKRILAILIAAAVLLIAVAVLVPTTLAPQISELRALEKAREEQEKDVSDGLPEAAEPRKHDSKEHELKSMLRQLTPVPVGVKAAFAAAAALALLLFAFYWITVAEWLYKTAVLQGLNRALWPMLGLVFNILVLPVLLIVLCDPKRPSKQVQ